MSPADIFPACIKKPPKVIIIVYMMASKILFTVPKPAIYVYLFFLISRNLSLSFSNFSTSTSSFAKDLTTFEPSSESSRPEFKSPM